MFLRKILPAALPLLLCSFAAEAETAKRIGDWVLSPGSISVSELTKFPKKVSSLTFTSACIASSKSGKSMLRFLALDGAIAFEFRSPSLKGGGKEQNVVLQAGRSVVIFFTDVSGTVGSTFVRSDEHPLSWLQKLSAGGPKITAKLGTEYNDVIAEFSTRGLSQMLREATSCSKKDESMSMELK